MISPTLACADYLNLGQDIKELDRARVDFFHIDIMDGHYVPNLCLNLDFIRAVRSMSKTPMDVHLMVTNPFEYIDILANEGIEYLSAHLNFLKDRTREFIDKVRDKGMKVGLVVSPEDEIEDVIAYLKDIDLVLVMFVKPGFSGQSFMSENLLKTKFLDKIRRDENLDFIIEADGGVGWENVDILVANGVDLNVAGVFAVFGQEGGIYQSSIDFSDRSKSRFFGK